MSVQVDSTLAAPAEVANALVVEIEGQALVSRAGSLAWESAYTNQVLHPGDRFRTLERSRALVRFSDLSLVRLGEISTIRIPEPTPWRSGIQLLRGVIYYFSRDKKGELPVRTPSAYAVVLGTEFSVEVAENETTRLNLIDGVVEMSNPFGQLTLQSGEAGLAEPGRAPVPTPMLEAVNVIQWVLYYPGVLDLEELELIPAEQEALKESLAAYGSGDLMAALARYPAERQPESESERVYLAALLLGVGQVEKAEQTLSEVGGQRAVISGQSSGVRGQGLEGGAAAAHLADALRTLIAAVKFQVRPSALAPQLSSAWLAESYYHQSRSDLEAARFAARQAVAVSPRFGFAWGRLAELEFSFGRVGQARAAVERALGLAPRNGQALSSRGFLLAAEGRYHQAIATFDEAIALDGAQGNAWLGRGLCRIHRGDTAGGLEDIQVAATLEPQRAALRSYLGKAFSQAGQDLRADQELGLARSLDPNDPTAWFYSALVRQRQNRINQAVRDLERSQELNDNRRVYRSRLLLDQDRAVRGANLANIYRDDGMTDVSLREAGRAVNTDYANYSAHLFLAESYDALRDPRQINLRYETPWLSEYLVANLLAPAAVGTLSPYITQQEYSRLFERDRWGLSSSTEYLSSGDWYQTASQYGLFGRSSYAADLAYRSESGYRPNNDLEQWTMSLKLKQDLTLQDSLYLEGLYYEAESGDVNQYYDQTKANPGLRMREEQEPLLLAGYHHFWAPGVHTLFLGGLINDDFHVTNPEQDTLLLGKDNAGRVTDVLPIAIEQKYRSEFDLYTTELQQIWEQAPHGVIGGARFQAGRFDVYNAHTNAITDPPFLAALFPQSPETVTPDFQRLSVYAYYRWQVADPLLLVAGLSYDWLEFPQNFRYAPLSSDEETTDQLSPKGGLIWTPTAMTTVRAGYAQALSGVSFDQSFQLEPTQIAGFNQAFRSLIPESVAGANAGAPFETWGLSLEQRFRTGTYLALSGGWLESDFERTVGVYDYLEPFTVVASDTRERLDFTERSLALTANQLLNAEWSLGARYRLSQAELQDDFLNIPDTALVAGGFRPRSDWEAVLHQVNLFVLYNHPSGFFGQGEALWYAQSNRGYSPERPGDDFWQFNLGAGCRFARRHAELRVDLLNLADRDYRLNPLNLSPELPRERTLAVRFKFFF